MRTVVVACAAVALLAGCGASTAAVVVEGTPAPTPYSGPMALRQDFSDGASVVERSGAAGRALECEGTPYAGGGGDYVDSGLESVQKTAAGAVEDWLDNEAWAFQLVTTGYRVEREDGTRTLLSYDVRGRTKVAIIAANGIKDYNHRVGWGVESFAACDPAELPESVAHGLGYGVWADASGRRVPVTRIQSLQGAEHCHWEDITFLLVGPERDADEYIRDVDSEFARWLRTSYSAHAALPDVATDTGFRRDGRELWLTPNKDAAYLVSIDDTTDIERWPAATRHIGCA